MSKTSNAIFLNRAVGLLVIEVVNSNPNGDPDRESDPRYRMDDRGEISPVSFKRKIRDLIADKDGPLWAQVGVGLDAANFDILEQPTRKRDEISSMKPEALLARYWDARVFGTTFLEKRDKDPEKKGNSQSAIKTGVVQFGLGVSVAPILIERMTNTNKSGVQEGKDRGMAPLGYRVVQHGVYCMPFFVNPSAAKKTNCSQEDIDLLKRTIPYAYSNTSSYIRTDVRIRHAWFVEHKSPLGECSDFLILDALRPTIKPEFNKDEPTTSWEQYKVPMDLPADLKSKVGSICDLANL